MLSVIVVPILYTSFTSQKMSVFIEEPQKLLLRREMQDTQKYIQVKSSSQLWCFLREQGGAVETRGLQTVQGVGVEGTRYIDRRGNMVSSFGDQKKDPLINRFSDIERAKVFSAILDFPGLVGKSYDPNVVDRVFKLVNRYKTDEILVLFREFMRIRPVWNPDYYKHPNGGTPFLYENGVDAPDFRLTCLLGCLFKIDDEIDKNLADVIDDSLLHRSWKFKCYNDIPLIASTYIYLSSASKQDKLERKLIEYISRKHPKRRSRLKIVVSDMSRVFKELGIEKDKALIQKLVLSYDHENKKLH